MSRLTEILNSMPDRVALEAAYQKGGREHPETGATVEAECTAVFTFSVKGFGFGDIAIMTTPDGRTFIDGECMSRERIKSIFEALIDSAILDSDQDPERVRQYDEVMRRTRA